MTNIMPGIANYLRNGILLTIPILLWNAVFASRLPLQFLPEIWDNIPAMVKVGENVLRAVVFMMPLLFSIDITTKRQKQGLAWYLAGMAIYFLAWVPLLFFPAGGWNTSMIGFMAPAYTPLLWLVGIGLLGEQFYFPLDYRPIYYIAPVVLFLIFHCTHAAIVYSQNF